MMQEIHLDEMKQIELGLLKKFDAFCKEHELTYWLSDGTLLGCKRHGGFIPWDDDVDVNMPEEDYLRLCQLVNDGAVIGEDTRFGSPLVKSDIPYHCPFGKLYDTRTTLKQSALADHVKVDEGVWMDIFPIVGLPDDEQEREQVLNWFSNSWLMIWLSSYRFNLDCGWKRKIKRLLLYIPARIRGMEHYLLEREAMIESLPSYTQTTYCCAPAYSQYLMPSKLFKPGFEPAQFEDAFFPVPIAWEEYLSTLYGDWQTPPPEDKRNGGHDYKVYWR